MELPQLQSLIGKDAAAYRDDFLLQYSHFQTERAIFVLNPSQPSKWFTNLVNFLTAVSQHYPGDVRDFPREIITYGFDRGSCVWVLFCMSFQSRAGGTATSV